MSEFQEEFSEEFSEEEGEDEEFDIPEYPDQVTEMIGKLRKAYQDAVNDDRKRWFAMYGFDHECSCATDAESGKTATVPECYLGACQDAFNHLKRVRGFLYAIATSPSKDPDVYRLLASEAFYGEPV